jgi:anti-sigma-K factor RskA
MKKTGIHFARVARSERLRKLWRVLNDGEKHTSLELQRKTGSVCIGTDVSELRHNSGFSVSCEYRGVSHTGKKIYDYQMVSGSK